MRVSNHTYYTKFFDLGSKDFVDPLITGVKRSEFKSENLEAHTKNCLRMSQRPDTYLPVQKSLIPVPPRSVWQISSTDIYQLDKSTFDTNKKKSIEDVQRLSFKLASLVSSELAVELSGGLDTAIVIGVLRSIGINPTLIGAISERFEFRTERFIQEKIASDAKRVFFINENDSLPFANLKETPLHPVPNKTSLFYYLNEVTAKLSVKNSIKYVLNGVGFDAILIDQISEPTATYFFNPINLDDVWANDYVFRPNGIQYVNVASIYCILKTLITMRVGQPEDTQKIWARKTFENLIPKELSKYRYKASFGAVYDEGLEQARSDILDMCKLVYDLTGIDELHPSIMEKLLNGVRSYDHKAEFAFLARLSYVNWIYQLNRANLILED